MNEAVVWSLGGLAVVIIVLVVRALGGRGRASLAAGFEPAPDALARVEAALSELVAGPAGSQPYVVSDCHRRGTGDRAIYRFTAKKAVVADGRSEVRSAQTGFLVTLAGTYRPRQAPWLAYLWPVDSPLLRKLVAALVDRLATGGHRPVDLSASPYRERFAAIVGPDSSVPLAALPPVTLDRLARAGEYGFLVAHIGSSRIAFITAPGRGEFERQVAYVADWTLMRSCA